MFPAPGLRGFQWWPSAAPSARFRWWRPWVRFPVVADVSGFPAVAVLSVFRVVAGVSELPVFAGVGGFPAVALGPVSGGGGPQWVSGCGSSERVPGGGGRQ
ncbi:hypothetical protein TPA0910_49390 [Streptomyces hygroscopicus subsp. sporocinereus]|uniref:Uncharacterized protein n=1 Tax=Streptomyces hygroscopicus TaxID=1912 RepID=A0ABQ3U4G6_STRHY|nr:hypothetical protein TPA0910_49390 [Streptomyces hygroscopicus]